MTEFHQLTVIAKVIADSVCQVRVNIGAIAHLKVSSIDADFQNTQSHLNISSRLKISRIRVLIGKSYVSFITTLYEVKGRT